MKNFTVANQESIILTPNRRLSAALHKNFVAYQKEQGYECWQTPSILPITTWIQTLWQDYISQEFTDTPHLLSAVQEQIIWETILLEDKDHLPLLQLSETAEIAKSTRDLLYQWLIDPYQTELRAYSEYSVFYKWLVRFETLCTDKKLITLANLPNELIKLINQTTVSIKKPITLYGFTELTPQFNALFAACKQMGITVDFKLATEKAISQQIVLADNEQEILTMARWAKATRQSNTNAIIGCVIPDLEKKRDRVLQIFSEVFADENYYRSTIQTNVFNISAGKPLADYPLIYTALQLLDLHKTTITPEHFSYLLNSPFLGDAESERLKRAQYDNILRQLNTHKLKLSHLIKQTSNKSLEKNCPKLFKRLKEFLAFLSSLNSTCSYQEWANIFAKLLLIMGWPGERSLNSEEYQITAGWLALFTEYATFDSISKPVTLQRALYTLNKLATRTPFQAKTPEAPIQVLGLLEAAGLSFDHMWIAGLDDLSWPPQPKPNPFIPKSLQRKLNMPHATAERELIYCQQLTSQFKQHTPNLIISYAEKNEDIEAQASSLIANLPKITIEDLALTHYESAAEKIYSKKNLEKITDETAPNHDGIQQIRGGVSVIKQQALCPFRAFAEWRLHARELETPLPGLKAKDRGSLVHKILELVWKQLRDHETLCSLEEEKLNTLVSNSVTNALRTFSEWDQENYPQYFNLEKNRLHSLIKDWLLLEKKRSPFKVITSEKQEQVTLSKLKLSLRIDRIDQLENGQKLIIDYKTGKSNDIKTWFGERVEEPQLPLYSLLDANNTAGITFAQVATGNNCFQGISRYALDINGIKLVSEIKSTNALSWDEQISQWQQYLSKLSDDFYAGVAKVDPKHEMQTCIWCALKPLCRVQETH